MRYLVMVTLVCLLGCSVISFERGDRVAKEIENSVIQEKELSFESKEALAAGATLQNMKAGQVYYEGAQPKSEEAKIVYELSFDFMDLAGIHRDFDPEDPESIKRILESDQKALEEKDKIIHQLKEDVKAQTREKAEAADKHKKYAESAEREKKGLLARLRAWFWGVIGSVFFILVVLFLIQTFTGIPVLTGLLGGIRTFWKVARQTVRGVQDIRNKLKEQAKQDDRAQQLLDMIDQTLDRHQDDHVKRSIVKMKKELVA